ncbi:60S ribosomal protein L30-like [Suricata suricatta]|uniref:60S ribosomal protein L30-like n=1 Tax=Suricata suricatta TaxID=37032 RepID=UPI0011555041|nr:60S ribosomal protein L30-like [Suricata suricatta]
MKQGIKECGTTNTLWMKEAVYTYLLKAQPFNSVVYTVYRACGICSRLGLTAKARKRVAAKTKQLLALVISSFQLIVTSGKYMQGYKQTLQIIRYGKAKLVVLANSCLALRKSEIEYYGMLAKTGVHHYSGNNIDLDTAWRKYYRVCILTSIDPSDCDIMGSMPEQTGEKQIM